MPTKTTYVVQGFVLKRGRLAPGAKEAAPTQAGAVKRAEAWSTRMPGAAALTITADDETGELVTAEIAAQFGQVPDDFLEQLRGG